MHGLGEHCHRYDRIIDFFVNRGIRVYSFDHRGHGRTHHLPDSKKQGHQGHIDSSTEVIMNDIGQLIRRADDDGIHENVPKFLLGHSLGGLFVLHYALSRDVTKLSGLISIGKSSFKLKNFTYLHTYLHIIVAMIDHICTYIVTIPID